MKVKSTVAQVKIEIMQEINYNIDDESLAAAIVSDGIIAGMPTALRLARDINTCSSPGMMQAIIENYNLPYNKQSDLVALLMNFYSDS